MLGGNPIEKWFSNNGSRVYLFLDACVAAREREAPPSIERNHARRNLALPVYFLTVGGRSLNRRGAGAQAGFVEWLVH
jgi:hypothetical protein